MYTFLSCIHINIICIYYVYINGYVVYLYVYLCMYAVYMCCGALFLNHIHSSDYIILYRQAFFTYYVHL